MNLCDLHRFFRDADQMRMVRDITMDRLADDRSQEECRYVMRLWWQCSMSYHEVTLEQLQAHLSAPKLRLVEWLLAALEAGHDAVDEWIAWCLAELPVIEDRGYQRQQMIVQKN